MLRSGGHAGPAAGEGDSPTGASGDAPGLPAAPEGALGVITVGALIAGAAITGGALLNHFAFDGSVTDLNAGLEGTLNNWLTVVASFAAGLGALMLAQYIPGRSRALLAVAAIFALISFDDLATLHERISDNVGVEHIETAIFAPLYGYALFQIWKLSSEVDPLAGRLLRAALVLLATAIVIDLGASFTMDLADEGTEWPQPTRIAFEEGFEVAGWLLMAGVLLTLFCSAFLREQRVQGGDVGTAKWIRLIAWASIVAGVAITLGGIFNHFLLDDRIPDLNVELEVSLNNWITVLGSFAAALGAGLYALLVPSRRHLFLALAVAFLLLSIDDQIRIHERLGDRLESAFPLETLIFAPIYGAAFWLAWAAAPVTGARAGPLLRLGVLLLGCAIAVDLVTSLTHDLEDSGISWPQPTRAALEEGFEVAGWILISGALLLQPIRAAVAALAGRPRVEPPEPA